MGMAASQARYLSLTARKNNTEYAGQQINQQRTTLSNESANYNNQLLGLNVPTAPSVDSFTKITYSWETMDGTKSTINSIVPNTDVNTNQKYNYVIDYSYSQVSVKADNQNNAGKLNVDEIAIDTPVVYTAGALTLTNGSYAVTNTGVTPNTNGISNYMYTSPATATPANQAYVGMQTGATPATYSFYAATAVGNGYTYDSTSAPLLANQAITATTQALTYKMGGKNLEALDNTVGSIDANKIKTLSDQYAIAHKDDNNGAAGATNNGSAGQRWFSYTNTNENTGSKTIYYYAENDLSKDIWSDNDKDGIKKESGDSAIINRWTIGNETESKQEDNVPVYIARSSTGQMTELTIGESTYTLTTNTVQDSDAYNNATNKYEYEKAKYDKSIDDIDAKIAIVQQQDRSLEIKLKQLDTEQEAIQTEMDSVKKVIDKNIESGFKTFA